MLQFSASAGGSQVPNNMVLRRCESGANHMPCECTFALPSKIHEKKTTIALSGELFTWGKGRYGRLGHGDSEDQLRPKFVEALLGYRVIDVACGE